MSRSLAYRNRLTAKRPFRALVLGLTLALSAPAFASEPLGIDADGNGLWDDLQASIDRRYPDDPGARVALYQMGRSLQLGVEAGYSGIPSDIQAASEALVVAIDCLFEHRYDLALKTDFMKIQLVSTQARSEAYMAFNEALSGGFYGSVKGVCDGQG